MSACGQTPVAKCPVIDREAITGRVKMPRVLMAVPQYPFPVVGGIERQAHELSKALVRLGVDITVLSGKTSTRQPRRETVEGINVIRVPWSERKAFRFPIAATGIVAAMNRISTRFDVVHIHNISVFGAFVSFISHALGKPVLTKIPNVRSFGVKGMCMVRPHGGLLLGRLRRSDAVVALSDESCRELSDIGYPRERILAIPNGVSLDQFHPGQGLCPTFGCSIHIGFVGRLSEEKGLADLVAILPDVQRLSRLPVTLELVGEGPQRASLSQLATGMGVEGAVKFHGPSSNVAEMLRGFDMFVLPSYAEGNSNAILEAMACGLPIVSTRVGGTPMLVGPEGDAYLINPGDRAALTAAIVRLDNDENERKRLGEAMRRRAETHFAINMIAERYREAYILLAAGQRQRIGSLSSPLFFEA